MAVISCKGCQQEFSSKNVRYYMFSLCLELIELVLLIYIPMSSPHVRICQPSSSPSESPTVCIVLYETFLICSSYISHVTLPFPFQQQRNPTASPTTVSIIVNIFTSHLILLDDSYCCSLVLTRHSANRQHRSFLLYIQSP